MGLDKTRDRVRSIQHTLVIRVADHIPRVKPPAYVAGTACGRHIR